MSGDTAEAKDKWTDDDWRKWRANNRRLALDGWFLQTDFMLDGTIEVYATKDGIRIDRMPNFERDEDGNYISPVT